MQANSKCNCIEGNSILFLFFQLVRGNFIGKHWFSGGGFLWNMDWEGLLTGFWGFHQELHGRRVWRLLSTTVRMLFYIHVQCYPSTHRRAGCLSSTFPSHHSIFLSAFSLRKDWNNFSDSSPVVDLNLSFIWCRNPSKMKVALQKTCLHTVIAVSFSSQVHDLCLG